MHYYHVKKTALSGSPKNAKVSETFYTLHSTFLNSPRGERAMPSEIAETIYFLAHSKNIIGEIVVSDGGRSLY